MHSEKRVPFLEYRGGEYIVGTREGLAISIKRFSSEKKAMREFRSLVREMYSLSN